MNIIAIDLGKFNSVACIYNPQTQETHFETIATERGFFETLFKSYSPQLVVVEACGLSGWVSEDNWVRRRQLGEKRRQLGEKRRQLGDTQCFRFSGIQTLSVTNIDPRARWKCVHLESLKSQEAATMRLHDGVRFVSNLIAREAHMARKAREESLDPHSIQIVHAISRCVRQAFLCGQTTTG